MDTLTRTASAAIIGGAAIDTNRYRVTIAANEQARQPPQLDFDGLSLDNYMLNPVVMWAHDVTGRSPAGGLPVGRTLHVAKSPEGRLVAEFEFLDDDPFAMRVKNAWDKGFLRAASISWLPLETAPMRDGDIRDTRSDLLEWSIVPVPSDPEALRQSHLRMLEDFLGANERRDDIAAVRERVAAVKRSLGTAVSPPS